MVRDKERAIKTERVRERERELKKEDKDRQKAGWKVRQEQTDGVRGEERQ